MSLTDGDWVTHKFEQMAAFGECGLTEVVTNNDYEPDKEVKPTDWRLWKDKDLSARAQITQNLSKEVQPIVFDTKTTHEA